MDHCTLLWWTLKFSTLKQSQPFSWEVTNSGLDQRSKSMVCRQIWCSSCFSKYYWCTNTSAHLLTVCDCSPATRADVHNCDRAGIAQKTSNIYSLPLKKNVAWSESVWEIKCNWSPRIQGILCSRPTEFLKIFPIFVFFFNIGKVHLHAKLLQLCLTLCNPIDYRPPGSSVHGILHARILEWVAMP